LRKQFSQQQHVCAFADAVVTTVASEACPNELLHDRTSVDTEPMTFDPGRPLTPDPTDVTGESTTA